jgi:CDP-paratose 2-epimerase
MRALITGGAGFIGSNLANRLLSRGDTVIIFDNFSREGVRGNISWLKKNCDTTKLKIVKADVRDYKNVLKYTHRVDAIFHLAAQVAVTTSVDSPREDFEVNAGGTLNVLEAARTQKKMPIVVYSSTNKVYGSLENVKIGNGITEKQAIDLYSPYGCSKGAADQYTHDYARIYGLPTVVFRQSCVYGQRQLGTEDQGWLAHFVIQALNRKPVTIFGDGRQVRDLLFVDDLIESYLLAVENIDKCKGEIFNIGGGRENAISILKAISLVEERVGIKIKLKSGRVRPGDQKVFISDNTKLQKVLGFQVKTSYSEGLNNLITWLQENQKLQK